MGYTTTFRGRITISPPLDTQLVAAVNQFCDEPQGIGSRPSTWCDWLVAPDGASIGWSGAEKSSEMDSWLKLLITHYFIGHVLNGEMLAQGEEPGDVWKLCVKDNVVSKRRPPKEW